jgi:hypothetical protein
MKSTSRQGNGFSSSLNSLEKMKKKFEKPLVLSLPLGFPA